MYHWPTADAVHIMGILNTTPDSFSDGGRFAVRDAALRHAEQMLNEGADIVDVGGESTRPGAAAVAEQEELDRVIPIIEVLRDWPVAVSIDTSKTSVMAAAISAGAAIVNDVNALRDAGALALLAQHDTAIALMHMQGEPRTMQQQPNYHDVVTEVHAFLQQRISACEAVGIARSRIAIDPGFGFGKTVQHNLTLLKQLDHFNGLCCPILVGLSRKSLIGQLTQAPIEQRLIGSVVLAQLALQKGARVLRVHDVKATRDMVTLWQAVQHA
jgi:dihydropteroate synthase